MPGQDIFAAPRIVTNIEDCFFYHTMLVPGYGVRSGQWDLRPTIGKYLGGVSFRGKRVLDVGTADGYICYHAEAQGADVVAYDLSENDAWDMVPFAGYDYKQYASTNKNHIKQLNNAFWLCHQAFDSHAKMVYGTVYDLPQGIGTVDISIFGSILLHLRDPFKGLQSALGLTKETVIIAEPLSTHWLSRVLARMGMPYMQFVPRFRGCEPKDSWWYLTPAVVREFIGVLGFENVQVHYHIQQYGEWGGFAKVPYYTVVGHRTKSGPDAGR